MRNLRLGVMTVGAILAMLAVIWFIIGSTGSLQASDRDDDRDRDKKQSLLRKRAH